MQTSLKICAIAGAISLIGLGSAVYLAPGAFASPRNGNAVRAARKAEPPPGIQIAQAAPPVPIPAAAAPAASGGADSLNEAYQDWQVNCRQQEGIKRCAFSQNQVHQNGQHVLSIELGVPAGDRVAGALVLPFGLALGSGASLQLDGKPLGPPLRFQTCLPVGCIVPLGFDAAALNLLRTGKALEVRAFANGAQEAVFPVSLQGFAAALDRITQLTR